MGLIILTPQDLAMSPMEAALRKVWIQVWPLTHLGCAILDKLFLTSQSA